MKDMVVTLYKSIKYDKDGKIYIFKPIEVLQKCKINIKTDVLTTKNGKKYNSCESQSFIKSGDKIGYGYPMNIKDLVEAYGVFYERDAIECYKNSMFNDVVFGIYDEKTKSLKTVLADTEYLKNMTDESWFYNFTFDYDGFEEKTNIIFDKEVIDNLYTTLERKDYEKIKEFLINVKNQAEENETFIKNQLEGINDDIRTTINIKAQVTLNEKKEITESLSELNNLVGLENVKKEIYSLTNRLKFMSRVKEHTNLEQPNLHMFFTGNPGTGKTTVARVISEILYSLDYTQNGKFAELTTSDLIGEYVGQTGPKTQEVLEQNKGGVVFIDEAYSFSGEGQEFGQEALVEIIKEMEKRETVFIFAGYKDEMEKFIEMNPGLKSRIDNFIDYMDYSTEELYEMFAKKIENAKLKMTDGVKEKIYTIIDTAKNQKHFGNGRFVNKLFDKIITVHASNIDDIDNADMDTLMTLVEKDVPDNILETILYKNTNRREMGFQYKKK